MFNHRYLTILSLLVIFAFSCDKQEEQVNPAPTTGTPVTTNTDNNNQSTNNGNSSSPGILYSDHGAYAPFGIGSYWQYENIYSVLNCVPDSNGIVCTTDTTYYTHTHTTDTIIDSTQYFIVGNRYIRIENGEYYERMEGIDVKYMDEFALAGTSWHSATVTYPPANGSVSVVYHYTITSTNETITTNLGTFSNVRLIHAHHVANGNTGPPVALYYKSGIGLIKKVVPMINSSDVTELHQYNIQPL